MKRSRTIFYKETKRPGNRFVYSWFPGFLIKIVLILFALPDSLVLVNETVGEEWLTPDLFRFGASALLNDLLLQRQRMATGHYSGPDYVTID